MESIKHRKVLISGASIAGLSMAWWMHQLGYEVTIVELAKEPRTGGTAVDVRGPAVDAARRMGILDEMRSNRLHLKVIEFKDAADHTIKAFDASSEDGGEEIEMERDKFINMMLGRLTGKVNFKFSDRITAFNENEKEVVVTFEKGAPENFDLVLGCDGIHSTVRRLRFGPESEYAHFLQQYFSITIVNKLLIKEGTMQMYNLPGKSYMLNAYNNKTDIVFCFFSENEIAYDYRNLAQQRDIIEKQFVGGGWRTPEMLEEMNNSGNFYFDKFCQIKMPSWSKGRVALVGDAAFCASPASGMGASLAMLGATVLADALQQHGDNFELAFRDYYNNYHPYIKEVQERAVRTGLETLIPRTAEAIQQRNERATPF